MTIGQKVPTGTTLTPGAWYRITEIDPNDDCPAHSVGDVIEATELVKDMPANTVSVCVDVRCWFVKGDDAPGYGTFVTGLETSLSPTQLARKAELLKEREALFDDLRALKGAGNGDGACAERRRVKAQVDRVKAELAELEEA